MKLSDIKQNESSSYYLKLARQASEDAANGRIGIMASIELERELMSLSERADDRFYNGVFEGIEARAKHVKQI